MFASEEVLIPLLTRLQASDAVYLHEATTELPLGMALSGALAGLWSLGRPTSGGP